MIIPIPSNKKRFQIRVGIRAFFPFELGIKAFDATRYNTHYFRRRVLFHSGDFHKGEAFREITIPMPISPQTLTLELYDKNSLEDTAFEVVNFKVEKMTPSSVWAEQHMQRFIAFAEKFCEKAGYIQTGFYHSPDYQFLIHYLPQITGMMGETLATPARIHRVTGRCQVNQQMFKRYSIPVRLFILLHERQHFTIPTREEKPADLGALKLYLDLGYPVIEAVYAVTKIFKQPGNIVSAAHLQRTKDIIHFIDAYKAQNKLEETAV